jgi:transposase
MSARLSAGIQTLKDSERAYQNFFAKRADFPRPKKKGRGDRFRYPQGFKIDPGNSRIFLPKLGWIRTRKSWEMLGTAKNITVSSNGGKWLVSIQTEREVEAPIPVSTSSIGIDVGITRFATFSGVGAARSNTATTGKRPKLKSRRCTPVLRMPEKTSCTRPPRRSAKTTRSSVSKMCRCGICPGLQKARVNNRARTSARNPA